MNEALQNLLDRRSCRSYKEEQIKPEELDAILEAGTYAPTGRGSQSPLIVAIQDPETLAKVEKLNAAAMGNPDMHTFYGAPTVVVVFADASSPLGVSDANLVLGNILNAAKALIPATSGVQKNPSRQKKVKRSKKSGASRRIMPVPETPSSDMEIREEREKLPPGRKIISARSDMSSVNNSKMIFHGRARKGPVCSLRYQQRSAGAGEQGEII